MTVEDLATARAAIAEALEIVLPERVFRHPPTSKRHVTPSIFIDQAEIVEPGDGEIFGRFPVWIIVDGAVQAQLAALDDLVWNARLALGPVASGLETRTANIAGLRAAVIEVDMLVAVETLCWPPDARRVEIPPTPLVRTTGGS